MSTEDADQRLRHAPAIERPPAQPVPPAGLPDPDGRGTSPRRLIHTWFPSLGSLVLVLITCVLLPIALITVHAHVNPRFSLQDEWAEFDYVDRIGMGEIPRLGEFLLPSTLRAMACQRVAYPGIDWPSCDSPTLTPKQFGVHAYQYEAQQPPTYYAVTAVLRWIPHHLLGVRSLLTATRLTGIFWLVAGLLLLWGAGALMKIRPSRLAIGVLLLGCSPWVLYESSIVNNNASGVFAGSLLAFVAALAWRRRGRWSIVALSLTAFVVCTMDLANSLGVVVIAVLFLFLARVDRPALGSVRSPRALNPHWVAHAAMALLGAALAVAGWYVAFRRLELFNLQVRPSLALLQLYGTPHFGLILRQALTLLTPLTGVGAAYRSTATGATAGPADAEVVTAALLEFLVLGGALAWLFVRPRRWVHWIGLVSLPVLYLGGVAIAESSWLLHHTYPGLVGRYGLSVAPLLILGLVGSLRGRWAVAAAGTFAVGYAALVPYFLLG